MTKSLVQSCVVQVLEDLGSSDRETIILTSADSLKEAHKILAVSLEEATCSGRSWELVDGRKISVYKFSDPPPENIPRLRICNGGASLTPAQNALLKGWQNAAR